MQINQNYFTFPLIPPFIGISLRNFRVARNKERYPPIPPVYPSTTVHKNNVYLSTTVRPYSIHTINNLSVNHSLHVCYPILIQHCLTLSLSNVALSNVLLENHSHLDCKPVLTVCLTLYPPYPLDIPLIPYIPVHPYTVYPYMPFKRPVTSCERSSPVPCGYALPTT